MDLGYGQGHDAIPLARLRYEETRIDNSAIGMFSTKYEVSNYNETWVLIIFLKPPTKPTLILKTV